MRFLRDIKMLVLAVLLSGVLGGAVSCSKLQHDIIDDFQPNFRLTFSVPVDTKATETADYGDASNNEGTDNSLSVNDIEVYFFDIAGTFVTSVTDFSDIRLTPSSSGSYDPHYHLYDAQLHVDGISDGSWYRVVIVANRRGSHFASLPFCVPERNDWLATGTGATDEEKLYSTLEFNYSSTGRPGLYSYMSMNFGKDDKAYVPMWGIKYVQAQARLEEDGHAPASLPSSGTIDLLRALAKVRINIAPELRAVVSPTDFNAVTGKGGISLHNPVSTGYMTLPYSKVEGIFTTPEILNRDRVGGNPSGKFTNDWINRGSSAAAGSEVVYPMFERDGSYYTYLPEAYIGQAWMELEFRWKDTAFATPITHNYKLHFADYEQARSHYGLEAGVALTEEQLEDFRFPVMRNHYYIYTVTRLNPLELKFEVCEWQHKSTSISFN